MRESPNGKRDKGKARGKSGKNKGGGRRPGGSGSRWVNDGGDGGGKIEEDWRAGEIEGDV